jgi:two-component system, OmpR family, sensor histidine kinase BaeS
MLSRVVHWLSADGGSPSMSGAIAVGVLLLIIAAAAFARVMSHVGMPLGNVVAAANRVATGDYSVRLTESGPPFLRVVARAFNGMTDRLRVQNQQRQHLMADIAHELRTPLSVMQGRLEGLLDGVYPRDDAQLSAVLEETRVLARLVEDLRTLANAEGGVLRLEREPTDLAVLVNDVMTSFASAADKARITLHAHAPPDMALVEVDALRLREVLANLLTNAVHHTPPGESVSVTLQDRSRAIVIRVSDTGSGIAADDLPHVFDRFHKAAGSHGSGLGLTIARNLIEAHGGTLVAESEPGHGTTMTITLPVGVSDTQ